VSETFSVRIFVKKEIPHRKFTYDFNVHMETFDRGTSNVRRLAKNFKLGNLEINDKLLSCPHKLPLQNETEEKSMSSSERIDARQSGKCQQPAIGHRAMQVVKH